MAIQDDTKPKKKKKNKTAPEVAAVRTETWSVRVLNPPPETVVIGGRKINDRQIITLPGDDLWLRALEKAGYKFRLTRRA